MRASITSYTVLVVWCKTSFIFLCRKDFLRITDGISRTFGMYCGNKTGQNLRVTGDKVEIIFHSDGKIEQRGYLLNFTLVSLPSVSSGKWSTIKTLIKLEEYTKFISHLRWLDRNFESRYRSTLSD